MVYGIRRRKAPRSVKFNRHGSNGRLPAYPDSIVVGSFAVIDTNPASGGVRGAVSGLLFWSLLCQASLPPQAPPKDNNPAIKPWLKGLARVSVTQHGNYVNKRANPPLTMALILDITRLLCNHAGPNTTVWTEFHNPQVFATICGHRTMVWAPRFTVCTALTHHLCVAIERSAGSMPARHHTNLLANGEVWLGICTGFRVVLQKTVPCCGVSALLLRRF